MAEKTFADVPRSKDTNATGWGTDKFNRPGARNEHGAKTLKHEDVPQPGHPSLKLEANTGANDAWNKPYSPSEKLNTMIQGE